MKNRILISILTIVLLLTPITVSAQEETTAAGVAESTSFSSSLYENNEIADEVRITFEYAPEEQAPLPNTPEVGCEAVYIADPVTGKVFYEKNADQEMYPASTTKILTALVVLENCDPDETAVVSENAIAMTPEGHSNAQLKAGEELTVYTLLQALLIPSANEAAYVLAEHVSGSAEAFAEVCNKRAEQLGCKHLHFVNPNGIHDENHYCSAYDLFLIAKECQKYEVFNEIVQSTGFTVPATNVYPKEDRTFPTTNELLLSSTDYYYADCTGIKTGHTTPAGECLVASSAHGGLNLISVVLKGQIVNDVNQRFTDTKALMECVYDNYEIKTIADSAVPIDKVTIENADEETPMLDVVIPADIVTVAPKDITPENVERLVSLSEELQAPIQKGQVLGTVTYRVDGLVYSTNLIAGNDVIKKSYWVYNALVALAAVTVILIIALLITIAKRNQRRKRK